MKALILSAGLGTRFRPHTNVLPKPAIPFLNIPLMAYPLFHLESAGLDQLIVNLHHIPEKVRETIAELSKNKNYEVLFSDELDRPLGSGGAIKKAEAHLRGDGHFVYANGDEVFFFGHKEGLKKALEYHENSGNLMTLLTCSHPDLGTTLNNVFVDGNQVKGFGKEVPEGLKGEHFIGVQIISEKIYDYLPDGESNIFLDAAMLAIEKGEKIETFFDDSILWYETGNEEAYLDATAECLDLFHQDNENARNLKDVLRHHKRLEQVHTEKSFMLGENSQIDSLDNVHGYCVIGDNVKVSSEARLKECVIGPDQNIGPDETIKREFRLFYS